MTHTYHVVALMAAALAAPEAEQLRHAEAARPGSTDEAMRGYGELAQRLYDAAMRAHEAHAGAPGAG